MLVPGPLCMHRWSTLCQCRGQRPKSPTPLPSLVSAEADRFLQVKVTPKPNCPKKKNCKECVYSKSKSPAPDSRMWGHPSESLSRVADAKPSSSLRSPGSCFLVPPLCSRRAVPLWLVPLQEGCPRQGPLHQHLQPEERPVPPHQQHHPPRVSAGRGREGGACAQQTLRHTG